MSPFRPSKCPLCRSAYTHFPRVCLPLHRFLESAFPEQYAERERENKGRFKGFGLGRARRHCRIWWAYKACGFGRSRAPCSKPCTLHARNLLHHCTFVLQLVPPAALEAKQGVESPDIPPAPAQQPQQMQVAVVGEAAVPEASGVAPTYRCCRPGCGRLACQPCVLSCGCVVRVASVTLGSFRRLMGVA